MRIAYLTAGAAGMYCGSCMHDNALARELSRRGHECLLLPVYTPIRTDEVDVSAGQVFFGGINVYLQQKWPRLAKLPRPLLRFLDSPWLLRLATRGAGSTQAELLGDLTVSMLQGTHGHQAGEVRRLVSWLKDEYQPDAIVLSNLLIGGCIPEIRQAMDAKILVWLQGDDIFLDHLPDQHCQEATALMSRLAAQSDACLVNSQFYADKMGQRLSIDPDRFRIIPLAIDTSPFPSELPAQLELNQPADVAQRPLKFGYFARLAPEKGFHQLVDAFIEFSRNNPPGTAQLHYGGWLGDQHREYFQTQIERLNSAGLESAHVHHGSPDRHAKIELLRSFDLFSVPTEYEECKGLYVLEALAAGVPVVQPEHGAFPELLASTGGGLLFPPMDALSLAARWQTLVDDPDQRASLARGGHQAVHARHTIEQQATRVLEILEVTSSARHGQ